VLGAYALFGVGFALVSPPIAHTAVSGMPPAQAGVAAAIATTSRQVGLTLGVAVFGALADGWWLVAVLGLAVATLGLVSTSAWARRTTEAARAPAAPRPRRA
jgi:hypothetical protein